jgi:hypothetical protein
MIVQNECSVESLPPVAVLELPEETAISSAKSAISIQKGARWVLKEPYL